MGGNLVMNKIRRIDRYINTLNKEKRPLEHGIKAYSEEHDRLTGVVRRVKALGEIKYPNEDFEKRLIKAVTAEIPSGNEATDGGRIATGTERSNGMRLIKSAVAITAAAFVAAFIMLSVADQCSPKESSSFVYAMEKAMQAIKAYHGIIEYSEINGLGETVLQSKKEVWADSKGNYYVKELEGVSKGCITVNNGQMKWQIRQKEQVAYIFQSFPDPYRFSFELGRELEDVRRALTIKEVGEDSISGRETLILEITPDAGLPYRLWIDKESKLPLQRESAMQNALMYKMSYSFIEFADAIPDELLSYELPAGFAEINNSQQQLVAGIEEARKITGIQILLPDKIPDGYFLDKIAVVKSEPSIQLYYNKKESIAMTDSVQGGFQKTNPLVVIKGSPAGEFKPEPGSLLGQIGGSRAEIIDDGLIVSVRWQQEDMEYTVLGNDSMEVIKAFIRGMTDGELLIRENNRQSAEEPQIKVEVDFEAEENQQKNVDAGHSPWLLDPVYVSQVFASLLLSPEGITGDYPVPYEAIELVENDGVSARAVIHDDKSVARVVYLKRLVRQDDTGIWTVIGYDTDNIK